MTGIINDISSLMSAIAVKGTENRRRVITGILTSEDIKFESNTYKAAYDYFGNAPDPVNIEVDLTGYCSDPAAESIVFTAHYDVFGNSTGANDNGSSLCVLLQLARHIRHNGSRYPVRMIFFDQEEMMGRGSEAYFSAGMAGGELFINLDVVGYGERIVFCDKSRSDLFVREKLTSQANMNEYGVLLADMFPFSDASKIRSYGYPVLGISVFPEVDTQNLPEKIGYTIMESMHENACDSIECINYDIMEKLASMLINALK